MDAQATRLVLVPAATAARVVASALPAARPRGLTAFEEQPVDVLHARHWAEQLRSTGPPSLPASARPAGSASTLSGHGGHTRYRGASRGEGQPHRPVGMRAPSRRHG